MAAKKTKLSIYLIKADYDAEEDILAEEKDYDCQPIPGRGNVYHAISFSSKPKWVKSFFGDSIDDEQLFNATASAVLLVPIEVREGIRYFAITFGRGLSLINKNAIEERFGLKTVLNSVEPDSIRRISKTVIAGNASKSNEQMPKKSEINDFSLDVERDLLNGITATGDADSLLPGSVTGADPLSISTSIRIEELADYLVDLLDLYESDRYKENFPWVDHVEPVKNKALKSELNKALIGAINMQNECVWMAIPQVINWEETAGFRYLRNGELFDDILIEEVLKTLRNPLEKIDQLKNKTIYQIGAVDGSEINHWSAFKCIYGELEYEDHQYCINGGEWYRIDSDYVGQINDQYESTTISSFEFLDYLASDGNEGSYNKRVCDSEPEARILMDQKVIMHGGGNSRFELCDILVRDGSFVHVKKYSGSAPLSHLFNQGLTTAQLVRSDSDFLAKANVRIAQECSEHGEYSLTSMEPKEVVFGIITKDTQDRPNIPFFSKITFCAVKRQLEMMNVDVSIAAICKVK